MIYLASPYYHPDPAVRQERYEANVRALAKMLEAGADVFAPIVHHHPVVVQWGELRGWVECWRAIDFKHLARATELRILTLRGWQQSAGVTDELSMATRWGLPVRHMEPV